MSESNRLNDDVTRVCPLCNACVRLFFINLNEKLLMCENELCEFPFGYGELQFFKEDNEIESDMDVSSISRLYKGSTSASTISTTAWSEIDKMNRVTDADEFPNFDIVPRCQRKRKKSEQVIKNDKEIQKNIRDLEVLAMELNNITQNSSEQEVIKNEKWIKNLMNLQGLSGVQLLKQQEIEQLKREEPKFGCGELKIDIDTNQNNVSSINIQIMSKDDGKSIPEAVT